MMLSPKRWRLSLHSRTPGEPVLDQSTGEPPAVWRGNHLLIQFAVRDQTAAGQSAPLVTDFTGWGGLLCELRESSSNGPLLAPQKSIPVGDLDLTLDEATWADGSKQHGTFAFSTDELTPIFHQRRRLAWLVITALDGAGNRTTLTAGETFIHADGAVDGLPPPDPTFRYPTKAEVTAMLGSVPSMAAINELQGQVAAVADVANAAVKPSQIGTAAYREIGTGPADVATIAQTVRPAQLAAAVADLDARVRAHDEALGNGDDYIRQTFDTLPFAPNTSGRIEMASVVGDPDPDKNGRYWRGIGGTGWDKVAGDPGQRLTAVESSVGGLRSSLVPDFYAGGWSPSSGDPFVAPAEGVAEALRIQGLDDIVIFQSLGLPGAFRVSCKLFLESGAGPNPGIFGNNNAHFLRLQGGSLENLHLRVNNADHFFALNHPFPVERVVVLELVRTAEGIMTVRLNGVVQTATATVPGTWVPARVGHTAGALAPWKGAIWDININDAAAWAGHPAGHTPAAWLDLIGNRDAAVNGEAEMITIDEVIGTPSGTWVTAEESGVYAGQWFEPGDVLMRLENSNHKIPYHLRDTTVTRQKLAPAVAAELALLDDFNEPDTRAIYAIPNAHPNPTMSPDGPEFEWRRSTVTGLPLIPGVVEAVTAPIFGALNISHAARYAGQSTGPLAGWTKGDTVFGGRTFIGGIVLHSPGIDQSSRAPQSILGVLRADFVNSLLTDIGVGQRTYVVHDLGEDTWFAGVRVTLPSAGWHETDQLIWGYQNTAPRPPSTNVWSTGWFRALVDDPATPLPTLAEARDLFRGPPPSRTVAERFVAAEAALSAHEQRIASLEDIGTPQFVDIATSDVIAIIGDSYTEGCFSPRGKTWINKISALTDYRWINYAISGQTYWTMLHRARENTPLYNSTIGFQDIAPAYTLLHCFTNDIKYQSLLEIQENIRQVIEFVRSLGSEPILSTEYHTGSAAQRNWQALLEAAAEEYGVPCANIVEDTIVLRGADYPPFWSGSHAGVRTCDLFAMPMAYLFQRDFPAPRQGVKIFRLRSGASASLADLLVDASPVARVRKWKELDVGHRCLANAKYLDRLDLDNDSGSVQDEYLRLQAGQSVVIGGHALVEVILPVVNPGWLRISLPGAAGASVYARRVTAAPYPSRTYYHRFTVGAGVPGVPAGQTYSWSARTYTLVDYFQDWDGRWIVLASPHNGAHDTNSAGTLTRVTGTGPATIAFTQVRTALDPEYHRSFGQPAGHWVALAAAGADWIVSDPVGMVQEGKLQILVVTGGGWTATASPVVHYGGGTPRRLAPPHRSLLRLPFADGSELLPETKLDAASIGGWAGADSMDHAAPLDGVLPDGITGIITLQPGESCWIQSDAYAEDLRRSWPAQIEVWARHFPAMFDDPEADAYPADAAITDDSDDYARLRVDQSPTNNWDLSSHRHNALVGLHWHAVRFRTLLPSRTTRQWLRVTAVDQPLQLALVSLRKFHP